MVTLQLKNRHYYYSKIPRLLGVFEFCLKFSESIQFAQILIFFISLSQQAVFCMYMYE